MNWVFTPAFCKAAMLKGLIHHLHSNPDHLEGFKHVVIDQHYPVEKEKNQKQIRELCKESGSIYVDSLYDRGLHRGLNHAMKVVGVESTDIFIGCDPDDRPSVGSFKAMKKVMENEPMVAVCGLNFWVLPWKQKKDGDWPKEKLGGENVWVHPGVEMWNIAAFNLPFITRLGGFHQPNAFYGGIEVFLYEYWRQHGMKLVYLIDHTSEAVPVDRDNPDLYDKTYGTWKIDHACHGYLHGYEQWLKEKNHA